MPDVAFLRAVCERITYKPGWSFRAANDGQCVLITYSVPSSTTPGKKVRLSHHVSVSGMADDYQAVVARVLAGVEYVELHEIKEFYRYDGERVFGPHG